MASDVERNLFSIETSSRRSSKKVDVIRSLKFTQTQKHITSKAVAVPLKFHKWV